jgi:hypothetical protein
MSVALTHEQAAAVSTTSGTRYEKATWQTFIEKAIEGKKSLGNVETDFPGVKPAHVRHMLKLTLKNNPTLAKHASVGKDEKFGIVLKIS